MTPDCSRFDLPALHRAVATWWKDQVEPLDLDAAEALALALSRQVAQVMLETALTASTGKATYQGARRACGCGGTARFVGYRSRWLRTLCGDQRLTRAYYHCAACHTGQLPWDEAAGLNERVFSPGAKALIVECCARLTHREVEALLIRVVGMKVEESSQQEVVGEVGERLRSAEAAQITACFEGLEPPLPIADPPDRLYVAMDAAKAHTDGSWHDVKCSAVYPGLPAAGTTAKEATVPPDRSGTKRYYARQEKAAAFGRQVYVDALASGLSQAKEVVVIGDGADWIWNLAAEHFHGATEILDYYHAAGQVWKLAKELYGEGSPSGKRWAQTRCRDLKAKGPKGLLRALARRQAGTPEAQEALRLARGYFRAHRQRMEYAKYRKRGLMIGSGPVEAACKSVSNQRLKGTGMRWSADGADAMLAARATVMNGQYERLAFYAHAA